MSVQSQIKAYLEASAPLMALASGGVWTRPLARPGMGEWDGIYSGDLDPTPQAFDEENGWVKPCIVISPRLDRGRYTGFVGDDSRYANFSPLLAYYTPPTDQKGETALQMSMIAARVLRGRRVQVVDGVFGHLLPTHEVTGSTPIPEMPSSGVVSIERYSIATVIYRD